MLQIISNEARQLTKINKLSLKQSYDNLFKDYLRLAKENKELAAENQRLINRLKDFDTMTERARIVVKEATAFDTVVAGVIKDIGK